MPTIRLSPFGGMRPAISSPLNDVRYGDIVCNAKLLTGSLKPLRAPLKIKDGADFKSVSYIPLTQNGECCGLMCHEECQWTFVNDPTGCNGFTTAVTFYHRCENKPNCLLYTSPSPRDKRQSRMPSSA